MTILLQKVIALQRVQDARSCSDLPIITGIPICYQTSACTMLMPHGSR